jgi:hypothetical protein
VRDKVVGEEKGKKEVNGRSYSEQEERKKKEKILFRC